jgi:hypothetical protein
VELTNQSLLDDRVGDAKGWNLLATPPANDTRNAKQDEIHTFYV